MKKLMVGFGLLLTMIGMVGCDRSVTSSKLNADGSIVRTVRFTHGTQSDMGKDPVKAEDLIQFSGPGWKLDHQTKEGEDTLVATSNTATGYILLKDKKPMVETRVKTEKRADGAIEYTETITYVGPPVPKKQSDIDSENRLKAKLKEKLAAYNVTDSQVDTMAKRFELGFGHIVLGPNKPMLISLLTQPDSATRELRTAGFKVIKHEIAATFPAIPADQVASIAKDIVMTATEDLTPKAPTTPPADPAKQSDDFTVLIDAELDATGTVVSTDGDVDELDGKIHWTFYSAICEQETVVLHAVIKP